MFAGQCLPMQFDAVLGCRFRTTKRGSPCGSPVFSVRFYLEVATWRGVADYPPVVPRTITQLRLPPTQRPPSAAAEVLM